MQLSFLSSTSATLKRDFNPKSFRTLCSSYTQRDLHCTYNCHISVWLTNIFEENRIEIHHQKKKQFKRMLSPALSFHSGQPVALSWRRLNNAVGPENAWSSNIHIWLLKRCRALLTVYLVKTFVFLFLFFTNA